MKKYLILLAMLLVAVANYAEKPANYVEASQEADRASDPLMLEGYFTGDTFSGQIELMTANQIPGYNTPTRLTIVVSNPVLSSYNWSVSGNGISSYISDSHLCEIFFKTGGSRGCTVTLSGPLASTGQQVTKVFGFY